MRDPLSLAILVLGLLFGSLVAAMAWRMPRGISPWGRSACRHCQATLTPFELVPLLSWLWLRGRCRHCARPISLAYPALELGNLGLWWLAWQWVGLAGAQPLAALLLCLLSSTLLLAAVIDAQSLRLPDALNALAGLLGALGAAIGLWPWTSALLGAAIFGGTALALRSVMGWRLGREALGLGDVKLMVAAGLWLGPLALPTFLLLSSLIGLTTALIRLAAARYGPKSLHRAALEPEIPFGPALCLAFYVLVLAHGGPHLGWRDWPPPFGLVGIGPLW
jgi:leader peptidase (prepilin peptidase) / N-methyltransferase